jgi:hypothetical protein
MDGLRLTHCNREFVSNSEQKCVLSGAVRLNDPGLKGFIKRIHSQFTQPDDDEALGNEEATTASSQGRCDPHVWCPGVLLFNFPTV